MILYNITVKVEHLVHDEWFSWMKDKHIPDVLAKGIFAKSRMTKILNDDESDGATYSIQYECKSMEDYEKYQKKYASALQAEHTAKFKNRFAAFRTLMIVVDEKTGYTHSAACKT